MARQAVESISELIRDLQLEGELTSAAATAERVASMYGEVFEGVGKDPADILQPLISSADSGDNALDIVTLSSVKFYSMCEHHFLPFFGYVDISYLPGEYIIGLGKLTRLIKTLARRPQLQERLTQALATAIDESLRPQGVAVHIVAHHLCEAMRGNREENQQVTTFRFLGRFKTDASLQSTFLNSLSKPSA